jgi:hypothetical protein
MSLSGTLVMLHSGYECQVSSDTDFAATKVAKSAY